ncbi:MAG: site-2 protease family protein [Deltaproteobacteria bacterium]|nr:site-2 protease family protein [Deltaproteobacteria bacterium]
MAAKLRANPISRGITLFRVAGIRISLDISWFVIFVLVLLALSAGYFPRHFPGQTSQTYWIAGFIATLLFFASVLIHELAHSLVAIRSGIEIPEITLFIFGGVSRLAQEPKDPETELKIAVVGPLSSFALAAFFWILQAFLRGLQPSMIVAVFGYLAWINLALGIFNLIPGFPLDGGRIFRAIWWRRTGSLTRATKIAADMGKGFALALMFLGGLQIFTGALISGLWLVFIGMFLRGMSIQGYEEVVVRKALEGVRVEEVMVREVISVPPDITVADLVHDYFLQYAYRGFPVKENGRVLGVVSLTAVKSIPRDRQPYTLVRDILTPLKDTMLIEQEASLADALVKMSREGEERLLVMSNGQLLGMVTKTGLLRFIQIRQVLEP